MEMVIGSNNPNKIKRLNKIINSVCPDIRLSDISRMGIKSPEENSSTPVGNLLIKLDYYQKKLHNNVICEDDVIEFEIKGNFVPIVSLNKFLPKSEFLFDEWKKYLSKNKIVSGKLIKYYGVAFNSKIKMDKIEIPLIIKYDGISQDMAEINILNNFIGPKQIGRVYSKMTDKEREDFILRIGSPVIKKLLAR